MTPVLMLGIGLFAGAIARMTTLILAERRKIKDLEASLAQTCVTPEKP